MGSHTVHQSGNCAKFLVDIFGEIRYHFQMTANWILKNGVQNIECSSFPYAYRAMHNMVRKAMETKQNVPELMKQLSVVGPANYKGERRTYSYTAATQMARSQGLLSADGQLNSKEFKRK